MTKWDKHFLHLAQVHSELSKDPSTKVGAIIVNGDRQILSSGFNGFPRGIEDTEERLNNRDTKLKLVVHAEQNAICAAAWNGTRLLNGKMYITHAPCSRCSLEIIQSGVYTVKHPPISWMPERWQEDMYFAQRLLREAGIIIEQLYYDAA